MTPVQIAEIRERHRPKPNRDYTDCGECYEEHPCETIQALDALAAASEREQAYRAALLPLVVEDSVIVEMYERRESDAVWPDERTQVDVVVTLADVLKARAVLAAGGPADGRGRGEG